MILRIQASSVVLFIASTFLFSQLSVPPECSFFDCGPLMVGLAVMITASALTFLLTLLVPATEKVEVVHAPQPPADPSAVRVIGEGRPMTAPDPEPEVASSTAVETWGGRREVAFIVLVSIAVFVFMVDGFGGSQLRALSIILLMIATSMPVARLNSFRGPLDAHWAMLGIGAVLVIIAVNMTVEQQSGPGARFGGPASIFFGCCFSMVSTVVILVLSRKPGWLRDIPAALPLVALTVVLMVPLGHGLDLALGIVYMVFGLSIAWGIERRRGWKMGLFTLLVSLGLFFLLAPFWSRPPQPVGTPID